VRALLVRVGADQTEAGGLWNGPADSKTGRFVYVPIRESCKVNEGFKWNYDILNPDLSSMGCRLPDHLKGQPMHLDPDFSYLTYGDQGVRGSQISEKLKSDDLLVFYAAFKDVSGDFHLVYALIGLFVIQRIVPAADIPQKQWYVNAHTRRVLDRSGDDIVVWGKPKVSGRFDRCIPVGEFRNRAYRVSFATLEAWGGLYVKNGYLQRSARLPEFKNADTFYNWFKRQGVGLIQRNN